MKLPTIKGNIISVLAAAAMLATTTSFATTFDYTYVFASTVYGSTAPAVVTGSFEGTQNGDLITGINNVTLFINEVQKTPVSVSSQQSSGPVASFVLGKNDFIFSSLDFYSFTFQLAPAVDTWVNGKHIVVPNGTQYLEWDGYENEAHGGTRDTWSLTARSVPDSGMTALLLGFGMTALGLIRRKLT